MAEICTYISKSPEHNKAHPNTVLITTLSIHYPSDMQFKQQHKYMQQTSIQLNILQT